MEKMYELAYKYYRIIHPPLGLNSPLGRIQRLHRTINSFSDEQIPILFRFRSKNQLMRLLDAFKIPDFLLSSRHKFHREEWLLASLYRLHRPTTCSDPFFKDAFGFDDVRISLCFNSFVQYITSNWGYLVLDHIPFWLDKLPAMSEAIRQKLFRDDCPFGEDFAVFGFIDNTMNATCRPGGGPTRDGAHAPRNDPLLQRAWYNGWKKLHGMKWQTVDLPNGMNFHVWGPVSVRHNDIYTFHESAINERIAQLQLPSMHM
jgi:hypothetical protein